MRASRLFCPDLRAGCNLLSADESHHAVDVLRVRTGDVVELFDGAGHVAAGTVSAARSRQLEVEAGEIRERPFELRHRIVLAVAMSKAHRQSYLIEKCTELGVAAFWPIQADRSVAQPGDAALEKWSRRAVEAAKQCGRAWVPAVRRPRRLADALACAADCDAAVVADPDPGAEPIGPMLSRQRVGAEILVFVGPEGGWSDAEQVGFRAAGVGTVRLAPTILRTETAAVAVCAAAAAQSTIAS